VAVVEEEDTFPPAVVVEEDTVRLPKTAEAVVEEHIHFPSPEDRASHHSCIPSLERDQEVVLETEGGQRTLIPMIDRVVVLVLRTWVVVVAGVVVRRPVWPTGQQPLSTQS